MCHGDAVDRGVVRRGARRSVGGMKRALIGLSVGVLVVGSAAACSGDSGDEPTPVGGINGPARVDPDSGGADNDGSGG